MHSYKLREETRPSLWNVAPPLLGLATIALLLLVSPALWSWWGLLGAAIGAGVALCFMGMARTEAVLDEMSRDGEG